MGPLNVPTGARRVVVVGGVAAGMSAASQVRRRLPDASVTVFERGETISYGACGMPYNIADPDRDMDDLIVLTPEKARKDRGIDLHLRHEVVAIDPQAREIQVRDLDNDLERGVPFDALVLASGARATTLPLPGFDLGGVTTLRVLSDGARLKKRLEEQPETAVIIGAGYIGLEMAHILRERGLQVTIVEKATQVLPGWHRDTVKAISKTLEDRGVRVITGAEVQACEGNREGQVRAVITSDERLDADLVVVAVGVKPNVSLAAQAGLRIGDSGAIWVNQYQQTSHERVWAAGDCSESYHRILRKNAWIPLGTTANKQGRIAGANATGAGLRFAGIVGTAGFVVFDMEVARSGLGVDQSRAEDFDPVWMTIRQRSRAHGIPGGAPVQVTLIADQPSGLLLGGEIVGTDGAALRINILATALAAHMTVADLQNLDLAYAPPFAPVWDPVLVAANQLTKKVGRNP